MDAKERIALSLFTLRLGTFIVMAVWTIDKFVNPDASVTAVNVTINFPEKSLDEVPEVTNFVRAMVENIRSKYPEIDFRLTGIVFMDNSLSGQRHARRIPSIRVLFKIK